MAVQEVHHQDLLYLIGQQELQQVQHIAGRQVVHQEDHLLQHTIEVQVLHSQGLQVHQVMEEAQVHHLDKILQQCLDHHQAVHHLDSQQVQEEADHLVVEDQEVQEEEGKNHI